MGRKRVTSAAAMLWLAFSYPAAAANADHILRCDRPGFPADWTYIGFKENRSQADIITYAGNRIFIAHSEMNVSLSDTRREYLMRVGPRRWSLDKQSLVLSKERFITKDCRVENDSTGFLSAIDGFKTVTLSR